MMEYDRPPVFEAGVEARLASPLTDEELHKADRAFSGLFDTRDEELEFELKVELGLQAQVSGKLSGYRLSSSDAADIVMLRRNGLLVARRAPYQGWAALHESTVSALDRWHKVIGRSKKFQRLGVRYQNRIDVPEVGEGKFSPEPYVTILPIRPPALRGQASGFSANIAGIQMGDYMADLGVGLTPSPLLRHAGILVDIDVYISRSMNLADLLSHLAGARAVKNEVFESVLTDRARELFHD